MSAAAPPSATPPATAAGIESNDPLGYEAYAKTLWARINLAVEQVQKSKMIASLFTKILISGTKELSRIGQASPLSAGLIKLSRLRQRKGSCPEDTGVKSASVNCKY